MRFTEVGSEILLLFTSIFLQELMRNNVASLDTTMSLEVFVLTSIGILASISIFNMFCSIIIGCKKKCRMKALEKIRQQKIMIAKEKKIL